MCHAWDRHDARLGNAKDLNTGVSLACIGHHLPFDQRRRADHAGHLGHAGRHLVKIFDVALKMTSLVQLPMGVERHMSVSAQNGADEL